MFDPTSLFKYYWQKVNFHMLCFSNYKFSKTLSIFVKWSSLTSSKVNIMQKNCYRNIWLSKRRRFCAETSTESISMKLLVTNYIKFSRIICLYFQSIVLDIPFGVTKNIETILPIPKARTINIGLRVITVEIRERCQIHF